MMQSSGVRFQMLAFVVLLCGVRYGFLILPLVLLIDVKFGFGGLGFDKPLKGYCLW